MNSSHKWPYTNTNTDQLFIFELLHETFGTEKTAMSTNGFRVLYNNIKLARGYYINNARHHKITFMLNNCNWSI